MFDDLKHSFLNPFSDLSYFVKVTQVKKSIYVLIRTKRGEILGGKKQDLFERVKNISENICKNYLYSRSFPVLSFAKKLR